MGHVIDTIEHYWEGDALRLRVRSRDGDDPDTKWKNLTGADISFQMLTSRYGEEVLTDDHEDVTILREADDPDDPDLDDEEGRFMIEFDTGATDDLASRQFIAIKVVDADGKQSTSGGSFVIEGYGVEA